MTRAGLIALLLVGPVTAAPATAIGDRQVCGRAAEVASRETGVPLPILMAIARAESGTTEGGGAGAAPEPWPWTLNVEGEGDWLASRAEAVSRAEALRDRGVDLVDLGCFQINLRWHGSAFPSLDAMLDPEANALYAARFLADLFRETGDWRAAAAAYHSRDPERAEAYVRRLEELHAREPAAPADPEPPRQDARFTLTRATGALLTAARGPLVDGP